ncbi:GNAT family N-acetyltransferase [Chryseobacterium sp. T16E-39]|uniref:GNAT family N-acetyltransferase n=1 Tax=Chryseobacterium sp. T16E-39 TaxID=2015076 RepID=UPI000B5B24EA|nr:GNAT family N-acetyltransferase [Chryseobacterium sp. T16E-39]ASK29397.1 GNAT family N-acetyltransferase [Chryseobacterium sp. T16E-39]
MTTKETEQKNYIFQSTRLGFRDWLPSDVPIMSKINADPRVMEFFPALQSEKETIDFIERMQNQLKAKGFCYFAVDKLDTNEFIGFIGLSEQNFESDFTPCIDIGWRLRTEEWNKGYATEGAKRCLEYAFNDLAIKTVNSITPLINIKSEAVMKKIGMDKVKNFIHPRLQDAPHLQECVLYEIHQN